MGTPANPSLTNVRVAILATNGFEESELTSPKKALEEAGAEVQVIALELGQIQGMQHDKPGQRETVDETVLTAMSEDFDALVLPGGLMNPDTLRTNDDALTFVRSFFEAGKPVGAICHAPQILISADLVKGRKMTSVKAVQKDLENAGAIVSDEAVVVDKGLVTSRTPDDLPAFNAKLLEEFAEGRHRGQAAKTVQAA